MWKIFSLLLLIQLAVSKKCPGSVEYTVTFRSSWSVDLAPNPPVARNFAPLIWAASNRNFFFLKEGAMASSIQRENCQGGNPDWNALARAQRKGRVGAYGSNAMDMGVPTFTGVEESFTAKATLDRDHPYLWLMLMVFPSPDWCAAPERPWLGCDAETGFWRTPNAGGGNPPIVLNGYGWDAGTDSQTAFVNAAVPENPQKAMTRSLPIGNGVFVFGTFEIMANTFSPQMRPKRVVIRPGRGKEADAVTVTETHVQAQETARVQPVTNAAVTSQSVALGSVIMLSVGVAVFYRMKQKQDIEYSTLENV